MNVILFGFKGSGKTYFGKLLALEIRRPFIDTDELMIELYVKDSNQRLSIREIHKILGESRFRELENAAIHTLESITNAVIALGGGAVLNSDHVEYLQKIGQMVYLQASFDTIQKRILNRGVPSYVDAENPLDSLQKIYHDRKPIYQAIAARRIDTDLLDQAGVIAALRSIVFFEEPPYGL